MGSKLISNQIEEARAAKEAAAAVAKRLRAPHSRI